MSNIEFSGEEHAAVTAMLRRAVYGESFPRWRRLEPLRAALAKLDPLPERVPLNRRSVAAPTMAAGARRKRVAGRNLSGEDAARPVKARACED
jgi:hypothetical protein